MVRVFALMLLAALAAILVPAIVLPLAGPAQAARVVFLDTPDLADLPDGVTIDRWSGRQAVLAGVDAEAARALYAQGAILVYPMRGTGCLSLPQT
ncbi:hypothetical protein [Rhizobium sp.]